MEFIYEDIKINYERIGEGPDVILLHGWGCSLEIFKSIASKIASDYTVWAIDLPGFGKSMEPTVIWGTDDYTNFLEEFVTSLSIVNPVLIGHSFGGRLSILYSSRNPVSKVVLVDSAGIVPKRSVQYYLKVYSYKLIRLICTALLPKEKSDSILDSFRKRVGSSDYNDASSKMRTILSKVVNEDLKSVMPLIKAPVLLYWGTSDTATPISDAEVMEKLIPGAGLVTVPGAGHYSFLENPGMFEAVICSFLNIDLK